MPVTTTWGEPSAAVGSGGLDQATDNVIDETYLDRIASDLYRLGGTDGNAKTGPYQIGSTTSYSNANNTAGLTVNQGASDDEILAFKSSDVAHGVTTGVGAETDTFGLMKKGSPTAGGLLATGISETTTGLFLRGVHTTDDTTKSTSGLGAIEIDGYLKSGTSGTFQGANANVLVVRTGGFTKFLLDADGDSHQDVGTAWTNFADHDDVGLLQLLSAHVTRKDDPLRTHFVAFLEQNRAALEDARLVTFNDDGHHFVNWSRLGMLKVGAIIQLAERLARLEARLAAAPVG